MRQSSKTFLIENRHYLEEVRQAPAIAPVTIAVNLHAAPGTATVPQSRFSHITLREFLEISRFDFNEPSAVDINDRQSVFLFLERLYSKFDTWQASRESNMQYLRYHRKHLTNAANGFKGIYVDNFWRIIKAEFVPSYGTIDASDYNSVLRLLQDVYREFDKLEGIAA